MPLSMQPHFQRHDYPDIRVAHLGLPLLDFINLTTWHTFLSGLLAQPRCQTHLHGVRAASYWPPARTEQYPGPTCLPSQHPALSFWWGGSTDIYNAPSSVPLSLFCSWKPSGDSNPPSTPNSGSGEGRVEREGLQPDFQQECTVFQRDCIQATHFPCLRQAHTAGTLENWEETIVKCSYGEEVGTV